MEELELQQWEARKNELDLARNYLSSDYYWKRTKVIDDVLTSLKSSHKE